MYGRFHWCNGVFVADFIANANMDGMVLNSMLFLTQLIFKRVVRT